MKTNNKWNSNEVRLLAVMLLFGAMVFTGGLVARNQFIKSKELHQKVIADQRKELEFLYQHIDSLKKANDSIKWTCYPIEIELLRYKNTYDSLLKKDPVAGKAFEDILVNDVNYE